MASPGRCRPWSTLVLRCALLAAALLPAACGLPRFGAPDSASEEGDRVLGLWQGFFVTAVVVTLFVWVPLVFVLLRYRRRRGDDAVPSQRGYVIPVEVLYTVIPVVIVAVLFVFSVRTERRVTAVAARPVARVEVVGFQWGWQFRYRGEGFTVDAAPGEKPQLVVPVGVPSNLTLVATDVNHSFWVPRFLSKRDLIPGVDNEISIRPTRVGTYAGRCAEFCGLDHWRMGFTVRVVTLAEYREWVSARHGSGGPGAADATGARGGGR